MFPYEINRAAFDGYHKVVAAALSVSPALVDKYAREPKALGGDGERSPLEGLILQTRGLRSAGAPDADLPIAYLNTELGYLPPVRIDEGRGIDFESASAVREFGEYLIAHADILADGQITAEEAQRVMREIDDVQPCLARERARLFRIVAEADAQFAEKRRSPQRAAPKFITTRMSA